MEGRAAFPKFLVDFAHHLGQHPMVFYNGVVTAWNYLLMYEDGKRVFQVANGTHLCSVDIDVAYLVCATKISTREIIRVEPHHYEHIANNQEEIGRN